jgi:hypothetical protein
VGGAVGAYRSQLKLVSSEPLDQMAAQCHAKLRAESVQKPVVNHDAALTQCVRTVAGPLEPQTAVFRRDAPAWKWKVNVISSSEIYAFCRSGAPDLV